MSDTNELLTTAKNHGFGDYSHADYETREEVANATAEYLLKEQWGSRRPAKTPEQVEQEYNECMARRVERYRRNRWTPYKEMIAWLEERGEEF